MALAKGASMAGTATCSGEGGMIPPERDLSTKWYYQIIQSRYGFNPHHLMLADAVEFFIGQGCKVGLGGHLMGQKVTEQVAEMRSLPAGHRPALAGAPPRLARPRRPLAEDPGDPRGHQLRDPDPAQAGRRPRVRRRAHGGQVRPGHHLPRRRRGRHRRRPAHRGRGDRHPAHGGDPRGAPRAGGRRAWRTRSTSSSPAASATAATSPSASRSAPTPSRSATPRSWRSTATRRSRGSPTTRARSASRRASATTATPVAARSGITTQDPELRKRLDVDEAAERVYNFLHTLTLEVQMLARACGKTNVHTLEPEDLCALTTEAAAMAKVPLAGTELHPRRDRGARAGAHRARCSSAHLENPVDELPRSERRGGRAMSDVRSWRDPRRSSHRLRGTSPGKRYPYQEDIVAASRTSTWRPPRRARTSTGSRTSTLLEEEGTPAVFDRYSNSFIKIYFPIPEGRENEIARKVLITHLQAGNSYGIQLKEAHAKFPQPELGPWVEGSRTRRRGLASRPSSRAGSRRSTDGSPQVPHPSRTSSSARACTASPPPGTSPRTARTCSSSTRPASPPAPPASPAASCATTTSSPRCRSSWPPASRSGSPIPRPCTTTASGYIALGPPASRGRPHRGLRAPGAHRLPRPSCTWAPRPGRARTCAACTPTGARRG